MRLMIEDVVIVLLLRVEINTFHITKVVLGGGLIVDCRWLLILEPLFVSLIICVVGAQWRVIILMVS